MGLGGPGPLPSSGTSELDRLRRSVSVHFPVYETRIGPQSVLFAVHIDRATLSDKFDSLRRELWALGYIPILRRESGEDFVEVVRKPRTGRTRIWINLLLLAGTVATTTLAGAVIWLTYVGGLTLSGSDFLWGGIYFALPVMAILGFHEFAHYAVARRRRLDASLPYFIPVPPPFPFGTFGAFVSIREPFPDKKSLFDIGAAGPLVGFIVSIPITLAGLYLSTHSPVLPASYCGPTVLGLSYGNLEFGGSFFWQFLAYFFPTAGVNAHPLAIAGWVGIFVNAINLLPASQLDGGHVFRALFGERTRYVSYGIVIFLFVIGIYYSGWWLYAILLLFLGLRHPPPLNDQTPLGAPRYAVGGAVLALLVAGFVLVPIAVPAGSVGLQNPYGAPAPLPNGAAVAANLSATLVNNDRFAHGYVFSATVVNVTGMNALYLNATALEQWAATSSWRFLLPGGNVSFNDTATASIPSGDYVTVDGTTNWQYDIRVAFSNSVDALAARIQISVNQLCAPSGAGSASTEVAVTFP